MPLLPYSILLLGQETSGTEARVEIHIGALGCQKVPASWGAAKINTDH